MATWNFHAVSSWTCCLLKNTSNGPCWTNSSTMISCHTRGKKRVKTQPHIRTCAPTLLICTYSPSGGHTLHTVARCAYGTLVASCWLSRRRPVKQEGKDVRISKSWFDKVCVDGSVSHQGDVPVSRTQHLQDHLDLLEGWVTCIVVLLALHPQCAWVNVGPCAQAEVLLLVNTENRVLH